MAVDNAGHDELLRGVDHLSVFRGVDGHADFGDFAISNKDGAVLDGSMGDGEDGGVSNHDDGGRVGRRGSGRQREVKEINEVKEVKESEALCVGEESRGALHWAPPSTAVEAHEVVGGLKPVKSSEITCTPMLPFQEVPSNVPQT